MMSFCWPLDDYSDIFFVRFSSIFHDVGALMDKSLKSQCSHEKLCCCVYRPTAVKSVVMLVASLKFQQVPQYNETSPNPE